MACALWGSDDVDDFGSLLPQCLDGALERDANLRVYARLFRDERARHADAHAFDATCQRSRIVADHAVAHVASRESGPAMTCSASAASATDVANGPI